MTGAPLGPPIPDPTAPVMLRVLRLIALLAAAGSVTAQPFDPLQVRGWAAACTGCHASQDRAESEMPPLAGAGRDSLLAALLDFKSGRRPATVMHQITRGYADEQLQAIAAYFSRLPP